MKIAQIVSTPPFAWETGGCARVTYDLSKVLAGIGHTVKILTLDFGPPEKHHHKGFSEIIDGVEIIHFPHMSNSLAKKYKLYLSLAFARYLRAHIMEFDIIHLQDLISLQAVATYFICRKNNIPYILTTHGSVPWLSEKGIVNRFYRPIGIRICQHAQRILALNETELELCKKLGISEKKISIIPNGINPDEYPVLPQKGVFRRKFEISDHSKILLYLGRIHESKGIDLLIDAFSDIFKDQTNVVLVLAGPDDGALPDLQKKISSYGLETKVITTGYISQNDKMAALIDADVFITPKFTGFPITFLEACLCGTPIITTGEGDYLSWINQAGMNVGYNRNELKKAISMIINNTEYHDMLGKNVRKLAETTFNYKNIVYQVEKIYEQYSVGQ